MEGVQGVERVERVKGPEGTGGAEGAERAEVVEGVVLLSLRSIAYTYGHTYKLYRPQISSARPYFAKVVNSATVTDLARND